MLQKQSVVGLTYDVTCIFGTESTLAEREREKRSKPVEKELNMWQASPGCGGLSRMISSDSNNSRFISEFLMFY